LIVCVFVADSISDLVHQHPSKYASKKERNEAEEEKLGGRDVCAMARYNAFAD
jgi:hypothetical protein